MSDDKHLLLFFMAVALLLLLFACFLIYLLVAHNGKKNGFFLEKQQMLQDMQRANELHQHSLLEENERVINTVAREVHDNLLQITNHLRLHMHRVQNMCTDPLQLEAIKTVNALSDQLVTDARYIGHSLNSEYIMANGLNSLIETALERIKLSTGLGCHFLAEGNTQIINAGGRLIIFRIAQEALQNAVKHSAAQNINVHVCCSNSSFTMIVADDGEGFSVNSTAMPGIGVANMRSRAKLLKGELDISSFKNIGTTVTLNIFNIEKTNEAKYDTL